MKIFSDNKHKESGVVLLITVIISAVVMLVAILVASLVSVQAKLISDIYESTSAIYAADSGVECQLYDIRQGASLNCNTPGDIVMSNGAIITTTRTGVVPNFTIKSLGSFREVRRQFQVSF